MTNIRSEIQSSVLRYFFISFFLLFVAIETCIRPGGFVIFQTFNVQTFCHLSLVEVCKGLKRQSITKRDGVRSPVRSPLEISLTTSRFKQLIFTEAFVFLQKSLVEIRNNKNRMNWVNFFSYKVKKREKSKQKNIYYFRKSWYNKYIYPININAS